MLLRYSIFIFLICSLFASDTPNSVSAEKLIAAHEKALQEYARTEEAYAYTRLSNTIKALEPFDLLHIQRPENLSSKRFAQILNDYAFFLVKKIERSENRLSEISHSEYRSYLIQTGQYDEAIALYQRAIAEDPLRAIVYLNLADTLRKKLSTLNAYQEKIELTKEIKIAYLKYKKLSQKTTPWIEDFLRFNLVDTPPHDICEYIVDYANQGRLKEVYGSGRSVEKEDDDGFFQVEIALIGSFGFEDAYFFDKATDKEISMGTEILDFQNSHSNNTNPVPFYDQQYLLFSAEGEFVDRVFPIGKRYQRAKKCVFKNEISYKFSSQSDPVLCPLLKTDKHPHFIEFKEEKFSQGVLRIPSKKQVNNVKEITYETIVLEDSIKVARIDILNNGTEEIVHEKSATHWLKNMEYRIFSILDAKHRYRENCTTKEAILLYEMENIYVESDKSGECSFIMPPYYLGNDTGWFIYNGITYYETKFPKDIPLSKQHEFFNVTYIKDGKVHKACEAMFDKKVKAIKEQAIAQ